MRTKFDTPGEFHDRDPDRNQQEDTRIRSDRIIDLLRNPETNAEGTDRLFQEYETVCVAMALRLGSDPTLARELAFFALEQFALRERDKASFEKGRALKPYLQTMVKNAHADHQRRCQREPEQIRFEDESSASFGTEYSVLEQLIAEEGKQVLHACIKQLSTDDVQLLAARFGEDAQTLAELAETRGVAISTVDRQIKQALARLRSLMERAGINGARHGR